MMAFGNVSLQWPLLLARSMAGKTALALCGASAVFWAQSLKMSAGYCSRAVARAASIP
jgi:hypothetical protein